MTTRDEHPLIKREVKMPRTVRFVVLLSALAVGLFANKNLGELGLSNAAIFFPCNGVENASRLRSQEASHQQKSFSPTADTVKADQQPFHHLLEKKEGFNPASRLFNDTCFYVEDICHSSHRWFYRASASTGTTSQRKRQPDVLLSSTYTDFQRLDNPSYKKVYHFKKQTTSLVNTTLLDGCKESPIENHVRTSD
jgi:hypothetical protein